MVGQGSVEKLSAVEHGDGAPNATLDATPSLVMRGYLLLVWLILASPSLAATDETLTHGSVVLPLTGIQPAPAELVVLTPDGSGRFRVAGRLTP